MFSFPTLRTAATVWILVLAGAALAGTETVVDGVAHVQNGAEPADGVHTLDLEEVWRVGGDDEEILLGVITRALLDDENNIYLLDQQLSEVQMFSPDGEHLQTLGRQGSGPGEITNPGDFTFMPDGTLGLVQIFPGKIVKLHPDGSPAGEFNPATGDVTAGGFLALVNARGAGGNLVLSGVQIRFDAATSTQTRNNFVRSFDMDGNQVASYIEKEATWNFADNFKFREIDNDFIWQRMDVAPDGRVVAAKPRYGYEVSVWAPDGTLERVFTRDYESWTRSEKIRQRYDGIMEAQLAQFPPGTAKEIEDKEADITDLRVDRSGAIWVMNSREMYEPAAGTFATYDVFTPDGHFARQVRVICPGDASSDRLIFAGEDLAFQVTGFWDAVLAANAAGADEGEEPEPMAVVCYRVK